MRFAANKANQYVMEVRRPCEPNATDALGGGISG